MLYNCLQLIMAYRRNITKITVPRLAETYYRERLFEKLDHSREKCMTWISAPGGYGKTTLAASYIKKRNMDCLWYSVDERDADIGSFFYNMGLATREAVPRLKKPMPLLTPEYLRGLPVFSRKYFAELYRRVPENFVIVFDDYHLVPSESAFHDIISEGIACAPDGIDFVILSRSEPTPAFIKMLSQGRINLIGWNEIRCTETESKEILQFKQNGLDEETMVRLHKKTEGWVAGLVLLLETAKSSGLDYKINAPHTPQEIFDYFGNEVFSRRDREMQDFLLKTAFLPSITATRAEALTGTKTASTILSDFHKKNYFIERHIKGDFFYKYHPLFREFLISRASAAFSDKELADICRRAAAELVDAGEMEDAATLLVQARDWNALVPLMLKQAPELISQGRCSLFAGWMQHVPAELIENSPWLLYWMGACRMSTDPALSRLHFEKAFTIFNAINDYAGALMSWAGAVDTFFFEFADFRPLDGWIRWLDERIEEGLQFPSAEVEACITTSMTGALVWRRPDHPDMKKWVAKSLYLSPGIENMNIRLRAYHEIALYNLWMGDIAQCGVAVDEIRTAAKSKRASPLMMITAKAAEALFFLCSAAASARAVKSAMEGLEIAERSGIHLLDFQLLSHAVYGFLNMGDLQSAVLFLSKMENTAGCCGTVGRNLYYYVSAWMNLLHGNASASAAISKNSISVIEKCGIPIPEAFNRLITAISAYETGDNEEAGRQLDKMNEIALSTGSIYLQYLHQLTHAHILFDRNSHDEGIKALTVAMSLGRKMNFLSPVNFWRPEMMTKFCIRAFDAGIEIEYVKKLVRALNLYPEMPPVHIEEWPWPIRIFTMGRFEILKDGKKVVFSKKAPKKPLEMLKVLIASGSKDVSESAIGDILWPDADGDAAHKALNITLMRLRELLDSKDAVRLKDGRISLDVRFVWVDVWAHNYMFERYATEQKTGNVSARLLLEKAIHLYRGPFLADEKGAWAVSLRERSRRKFLSLIEDAGRELERNNEFHRAIEYYRKGLEVDDLIEEFYLRIMTCCIRLDRNAEAVSAYKACRNSLAAYNLKPSDAVENIYSSIVNPHTCK